MANVKDGDQISSPEGLSDRSVGREHERSLLTSLVKGYSDLDLSLKLHPIRKDIIALKDDQAVKNAVKNLILTNFYERPFQLGLGANLRGLLFEPADAIAELALEDNIKRVLKQEPRVEATFVNVTNLADRNAYRITVKFNIKQFDSEEEVEIVLKRLR